MKLILDQDTDALELLAMVQKALPEWDVLLGVKISLQGARTFRVCADAYGSRFESEDENPRFAVTEITNILLDKARLTRLEFARIISLRTTLKMSGFIKGYSVEADTSDTNESFNDSHEPFTLRGGAAHIEQRSEPQP